MQSTLRIRPVVVRTHSWGATRPSPYAWHGTAASASNAARGQGPEARGRILAVKWGLNPNSSSLGVDVTFLLLGTGVLAMLTPIVGTLLRLRRKPRDVVATAQAD